MTIEIHYDERDWEPGGIYYDGPCYTPDTDDEDYEECDDEGLDTHEAEHDYGDCDEAADDYDAPTPHRPTYQAPTRRKPLQMPAVSRVHRYVDEAF